MADQVDASSTAPVYGRFSGRLRAFVIDWIIIALLLVGVLFAAVAADSDRIGRILGFTFVTVWLLYEPVLVSLTRSTIGHYLCNLRVVDDKTHGNLGFPKAVARLVIKTVLGLYSFITMATTLRHQAVHDLFTGSTVQIRDRDKATPSQYVDARTDLLNPALPSAWRRLLVILAYVIGSIVVITVVELGLMQAGLLSSACVARDRCLRSESLLMSRLGLLSIGIWVACIIQGWRGRLYGCRVQRAPQVTSGTPT